MEALDGVVAGGQRQPEVEFDAEGGLVEEDVEPGRSVEVDVLVVVVVVVEPHPVLAEFGVEDLQALDGGVDGLAGREVFGVEPRDDDVVGRQRLVPRDGLGEVLFQRVDIDVGAGDLQFRVVERLDHVAGVLLCDAESELDALEAGVGDEFEGFR